MINPIRALSDLPFRISKSITSIRFFTLFGLAFFSITLIWSVINIVNVNEKVRVNEEQTRGFSQLIQSVFNKTNDLLIFLEKEYDNNKRIEIVQFQSIIKQLEVSGLAQIVNGKIVPVFGSLDPTSEDPTWEQKRFKEIEYKIAKVSNEKPQTFFLGFERRFRTKTEVSNGKVYMGSILLARSWLENNQIVGYIAILPMSNLAKYLRLDTDHYNSGDYDYIVDQEGNVICHPRLFIMNGTDINGNRLKSASKAEEVGSLPINTRDSDWIAGNDKLNQAFERMIRGEFASIVYKNLQNQARLTSFKEIPLDENGISGNIIGVVTGKGLTEIESNIAPSLLEGSNPFATFLYLLIIIYIILIFAWLSLFNRIRVIHRDLLEFSNIMKADTAKRLNLLPISRKQIQEKQFPNSTVILFTILSTNYLKDYLFINELTNKALKYFHSKGFVAEKLDMKSFIAFYKNDSSVLSEVLLPTTILDLLKHDEFKSITNGIDNKKINDAFIQICYTIGNVDFECGKTDETFKASVSIKGEAITRLLVMRQDSTNLEYEANQIKLIYNEESVQEMANSILGKKHTINNVNLYEINSTLFYKG